MSSLFPHIWTFFAALVGSFTALYIALKIYPKQREIDRKNEIYRELRKEYATLIALFALYEEVLIALVFSQEKSDLPDKDKMKRDVLISIETIGILGDAETVSEAYSVLDQAFKWGAFSYASKDERDHSENIKAVKAHNSFENARMDLGKHIADIVGSPVYSKNRD